jgi:hypothetical protein
MAYDHARIERLQAEIGLKRSALAEHRAALLKVQREVEAFARQYDRIIGPLEAELDRVRQEIESLQSAPPTFENSGSIWGPGNATFEDSFDAKYRRPNNPTINLRRALDDNDLRIVYRKLARKYHPDTTTDPDEKARLTMIMAEINAAYRARNIDQLYALDGKRTPAAKPVIDPAANAKRSTTYNELTALSYQLDDEILQVKSEHQRLLTSPLMSLKIEYSIARGQGRDLLREIAAKVREDLIAAKAELVELTRRR